MKIPTFVGMTVIMKSKKIKKFGFVLKPKSKEARDIFAGLEKLLLRLGCKVSLFSSAEKITKDVELVVILGGDGSLLAVARRIAIFGIPVLGVHLGQLGFIMETTVDEVEDRVREIVKGNYCLEPRVMLEAELKRGKKSLGKEIVLNDVVVTKGALARIFELNIIVDRELVGGLRGDGVIVTTPTGSTAYSLSAGGPIILPKTESLAITPICPHMLTQRPLVVPNSSEIRLELLNKPEDVVVTLDGQIGWEMIGGDVVVIKRSKYLLHLVKSPVRSYYDILKDKLKLGH